MSGTDTPREDLYVPDRFEGLREAGSGNLRSIIVPVEEELESIGRRFTDMSAARRGSLLILRGDTGAGKSTFLDTVGLFRNGVVTQRVLAEVDVADELSALEPTDALRLVVLEGREALGQASASSIEATMHAVNSFVRSASGRNTIVVWPTNTDDLTRMIVSFGDQLGAEALFGVGDPVQRFSGPARDEFVGIAERTVAALNAGASLAALGISDERAHALAQEAPTIGHYLALVRQALIENGAKVRELLATEQLRCWTVVIAGNDPEGDVAAVTRGGYSFADVDRLMTATGANIVAELKKYPEEIGILATVLDARVLHLDRVTALAVAREYGDEKLHELMRGANMSTNPDDTAADRLASSELGLILSGESLGTRKRGPKPGGGTDTAFAGLAQIARQNDGLINRAIGAGLVDIGLINGFETEKEFGTVLKFTSDLYCERIDGAVRMEMMWRGKAGRADIANYVLGKLGNYGKAVGLLS